MPLKLDDVVIDRIHNMSTDGFAWTHTLVSFRDTDLDANCNIALELPIAYRADETIDAVRLRIYEKVITVLRAAAAALGSMPLPPLDTLPPPQPGSSTT